MRKLFFAAVAAALLSTTGADAEDTTSFQYDVNLTAKAPFKCSFGGAAPLSNGTFNTIGNTVGTTNATLKIDFDSKGDIAGQKGSIIFPDVFCNGNSTTVTLVKELLTAEGALATTSSKFNKTINYDVDVTWDGDPIASIPMAAGSVEATIGATSGPFKIYINVPESSNTVNKGPFISDVYTGAVHLTVAPTS